MQLLESSCINAKLPKCPSLKPAHQQLLLRGSRARSSLARAFLRFAKRRSWRPGSAKDCALRRIWFLGFDNCHGQECHRIAQLRASECAGQGFDGQKEADGPEDVSAILNRDRSSFSWRIQPDPRKPCSAHWGAPTFNWLACAHSPSDLGPLVVSPGGLLVISWWSPGGSSWSGGRCGSHGRQGAL